jgi:hypothetical protein
MFNSASASYSIKSRHDPTYTASHNFRDMLKASRQARREGLLCILDFSHSILRLDKSCYG